MKLKYFILTLIAITSAMTIKAQDTPSDSLKVATTLQELLSICKNVDFMDPKTLDSGMFYKAAPYIIYRGEDKKRNWKDFANYHNPDEKKGVDEVCFRINSLVNQDNNYKITGYRTEKESEGTWHILMISYLKKENKKNANFAFLKIGERFGLGDID